MSDLDELVASFENILNLASVTDEEKEIISIYAEICKEFIQKGVRPNQDFIELASDVASLYPKGF